MEASPATITPAPTTYQPEPYPPIFLLGARPLSLDGHIFTQTVQDDGRYRFRIDCPTANVSTDLRTPEDDAGDQEYRRADLFPAEVYNELGLTNTGLNVWGGTFTPSAAPPRTWRCGRDLHPVRSAPQDVALRDADAFRGLPGHGDAPLCRWELLAVDVRDRFVGVRCPGHHDGEPGPVRHAAQPRAPAPHGRGPRGDVGSRLGGCWVPAPAGPIQRMVELCAELARVPGPDEPVGLCPAVVHGDWFGHGNWFDLGDDWISHGCERERGIQEWESSARGFGLRGAGVREYGSGPVMIPLR